MQTLRRSVLPLLILALLIGYLGFAVETDGAPPEKSKGYTSEMALSVELIDSATGAVRHTTAEVLRPIALREADRLKHEPLLRSVLNKPTVQQTRWFAQFENNLDEALADLREQVVHVEHAEGTAMLRAYATTPRRDDAQIILTALRDEYLRLHNARQRATQDRDLEAAQRRRNAAEEKITAIRGATMRFLTNTPLDAPDEATSEAALRIRQLIAERAGLEERYAEAEAEYAMLSERLEGGDFDPSDTERQEIEADPLIREMDRRRLELRIEQAVAEASSEPDQAELKRLKAVALALDRTRQEHFDQLWRTGFQARVEHTAFEMHRLKPQLARNAEALAEWKVRRQQQFQLHHKFSTLQRELVSAEAERDRADQRIAELISLARRESSSLGYRVSEEYPPQRATRR